jgi:hypothetical protein
MPRKKVIPVVAEPTSTCKQCKSGWYYADTWYCRRFPPSVYYDPAEQAPCSSFPVVAPDLTCGEFAPLLNS